MAGVLKPVVARYRANVSRRYFRADADFANPEAYVSISNPSASSMRSVCRRTASYRGGSGIC
jgi:hypothetical protein